MTLAVFVCLFVVLWLSTKHSNLCLSILMLNRTLQMSRQSEDLLLLPVHAGDARPRPG